MAPGVLREPSPSTSGGSSDEATDHEEDFPQLAAKRRRVSQDSDNRPTTLQTYDAPSRIQKSPTSSEQLVQKSALPTIPTTSASFESLDVFPWLISSLSSMEIRNPTAIQKSCIPQILAGRDCIGGSRTGTGKTMAFAIPILQQWSRDPHGIYAVILTPTRELAMQIFEQFQAIGSPQSLKVCLITGGTEARPQAVALAQRPHIVVATPGRLADHILTSREEITAGLKRAKFVVLDEADRLLQSGPGSMLGDVETCLSALPATGQRQTLLFTATVTDEVRALKEAPRPKGRSPIFVTEISSEPASKFTTSPTSLLPAKLRQTYLLVPLTHKDAFLHILLQTTANSTLPSILIFTNRTRTADLLFRTLQALDHSVTALHSQLPQKQRAANLSAFRAQRARILIATDVAGRGLDIPLVQLVINYDLPRNADDYVHRVGRTARAGKAGTSVSFVGQRDVELVQAIEERTSSKMEEWAEEGVNVETRVTRGRVLKDLLEARMGALREMEGRDSTGRRKRLKKER
jgi:ATP-dependent RNA helicase DDX49/DBP8